MRTEFELFTKADGSVGVQFADGQQLTVSVDGMQGYDFALGYLRRMAVHYRNHLRAADALLSQQLGVKHVATLRTTSPQAYNIRLAVQSMHCLFGVMDMVPDCDRTGELHAEFVPCPFRATCPYNGYRLRDKDIVCCNPIYDTGLPRRLREVADLLANTPYTAEQIGMAVGLSERSTRNAASEIYSRLGVENRQALILLLRNKRIV